MPRRTSKSGRRFHRKVVAGWEERVEKRIAEEAAKAELALVVRRLARQQGIEKAAEEEEE